MALSKVSKSKTKRKPAPKKKSSKAASTVDDSSVRKIDQDSKNIIIRMYNIGFGDCFLVQIPTEGGIRRVLVDCGVHSSGRNPSTTVDEIIGQVIEDIKNSEGEEPRIDILIATHRHQDHVSGFSDKRWQDVEVGEVWLPWTENYKDPEAVKILRTQSTAGKKIAAAFQMMLTNPQAFGLSAVKQKELRALNAIAENSLTNAKAMDTLHNGFKGGKKIKREYLPFERRAENSFEPKLLPGLMVHVMGPSREGDVIRDMDPAADEHWLRLMDQTGDPDAEKLLPFHVDWGQTPDDAALSSYIQLRSNSPATATPPGDVKAFRKALNKVCEVFDGTEMAVAVSLDKAVNGTSLMLMFEVGDAYLLFPGDAQNGTWQAALRDDEWRTLLTKTNFYKVGHHGSHNATPKEFVFDILAEGCTAMTPVYPVPSWKFIPKTELMDAIRERKGNLIRSDKPFDGIIDPAVFIRTRLYVETKIPIAG